MPVQPAQVDAFADGARFYGLLEDPWAVPAAPKKRRTVERVGVRSTSKYRCGNERLLTDAH